MAMSRRIASRFDQQPISAFLRLTLNVFCLLKVIPITRIPISYQFFQGATDSRCCAQNYLFLLCGAGLATFALIASADQ
jgi:hypothetical protein